jgi:hypothetical protein
MRSPTGERGGSDEAGPEFQNPVLKRLHISMDGAYFLFCGAPQKRKGIDSLAQLSERNSMPTLSPAASSFFVLADQRQSSEHAASDSEFMLLGLRGGGMLLTNQKIT